MAEIGFADLVEIYRNTVFDGVGGGILHVSNDAVAETINTIEADEALYDLTQIALVSPGTVSTPFVDRMLQRRSSSPAFNRSP